jgi:3-oxoadipate enol-lactonase
MPTISVNGHQLYYEIHGQGDPAVCMGGWGSYCHGGERHLARGLTDRFQVLILDYRGLGESTDCLETVPAMQLHADDVVALLDHLGWRKAHFVGLVGMGACIAQLVAIQRPDLVRSMVNMGAWASVDPFLRDQLELFRDIHRDSGWLAFQRHVCVMSFRPDYYNANRERLLGPAGPWRELNGRFVAHERLVMACAAHDVADQLHRVQAPSLVLHAGLDQVTGPRTTGPLAKGIPNCEEVLLAETAHVVAGREEKARFSEVLMNFLERH